MLSPGLYTRFYSKLNNLMTKEMLHGDQAAANVEAFLCTIVMQKYVYL